MQSSGLERTARKGFRRIISISFEEYKNCLNILYHLGSTHPKFDVETIEASRKRMRELSWAERKLLHNHLADNGYPELADYFKQMYIPELQLAHRDDTKAKVIKDIHSVDEYQKRLLLNNIVDLYQASRGTKELSGIQINTRREKFDKMSLAEKVTIYFYIKSEGRRLVAEDLTWWEHDKGKTYLQASKYFWDIFVKPFVKDGKSRG